MTSTFIAGRAVLVAGRAVLIAGWAVLIAGWAVLGGCSVERGVADTRLFACDTDTECGADWGCLRATPYAADFCAPSCDAATCDGVCVEREGGGSLCLRGCRIREDDTVSACPGPEFSCIRFGVDRSDGVCYPARSCRVTADCGANELCLSEITDGTSHTYCVPLAAGDGTCPPRSQPQSFPDGTVMCLATCRATDRRCPPSFACLEQFGLFSPELDLPCYPGIYGLPCADDTNCLLGRCLAAGGPGKVCTVTCEEAERLALGGCQAIDVTRILPYYRLECDPSAGGGADGGLCVPRYEVGFPCTEPESDRLACASGLECVMIDVKRCTRPCRVDGDCVRGEGSTNFCFAPSGPDGLCLPQFAEGDSCERDGQCETGYCVRSVCARGPG